MKQKPNKCIREDFHAFGMFSTLVFALSKQLFVVEVAHEFKARIYKFASFVNSLGYCMTEFVAFKLVCTAFAKKGKFKGSDKAQVYATQLPKKFTPDEDTQFADVINRYPEQQKPFIDAFSKMNLNMEKLLKQLKTSGENE